MRSNKSWIPAFAGMTGGRLGRKGRVSWLLALIAAMHVGFALADTQASARSGPELYTKFCAQCHEGGVPRAPHSVTFGLIGPRQIFDALETGVMKNMATELSADERRVLAEHLGGRSLNTTLQAKPLACTAALDRAMMKKRASQAVLDWGVTPANTRFVPKNVAGITARDVPRLKLKWTFAYPDSTRARSQPSIAGGVVFVGSQDGTVYALDLDSGCAYWTFKADIEVRTGITLSVATGDDAGIPERAFFGDFNGSVYAVNATNGVLIWKQKANAHPDTTITGTPKLYGGRLYVPLSSREWATAATPDYSCCTFRGGVAAFDSNTGALVWRNWVIAEEAKPTGKQNTLGKDFLAPSGAPVWNSPTIDARRNRLYVGTGESYSSPAASTSDAVVAFDLDTGAVAWTHQATAGDAWNMACNIPHNQNCPSEFGPDFDIGAATVLMQGKRGKDLLLVGQKSGDVFALDPDKGGALVWKKRIGLGGFAGGVHWGMALDQRRNTLYAPNADTNIISRFKGERYPGMFALDTQSGRVKWYTRTPLACEGKAPDLCDAALSAPATAIDGVVFAGGYDGVLRAFEARKGRIVWSFDTAQEFVTISGVKARGGAIEAAGPVIAGGHLLVNSGYAWGGRMGGNVLLAFAPE